MATGKRIYTYFIICYIFVIIAIAIGAAIFKEIEKIGVEKELDDAKKGEVNYNSGMEELRKNFSESLNVTIEWRIFESFTERVRSLRKPAKPKQWTWNDGFHFAFTVMSTIGYGDFVPKTDLGKVICMIYAIITIPLFLIALSAAGQMKRLHIELLLRLVEQRILKRNEVRHKNKKIIGITAMLFVVEVLIASSISYSTEEWSFLDCMYFWIISASTIGFGDYISDYNNSNGQLLFFNLLFTIIIQAGFATIFEAITVIISKKNVHTFRETSLEIKETTSL